MQYVKNGKIWKIGVGGKTLTFLLAVMMSSASLPILHVSAEENALPASYDLRDYGLVTSVKDQGNTETCWAHATMAAAESNMLKTGLADKIMKENNLDELDLSEAHLVWFGKCKWSEDETDPLYHKGNNEGVMGYQNTYDALNGLGSLAAWKGVQLEKNFPNVTETPKIDESFRYTSYAHLQNATFFGIERSSETKEYCEPINKDSIKKCLMENGAMVVSYYHNTAFFSKDGVSCYCPEKQADTNHTVTLIGWDDNYSRENFTTQPPEDGAWLCKNSWGEDSGNYGYFYISYSDPNPRRFVSLEMEATDNYDSVYQIDGGKSLNSGSGNYLYGFAAGNVFTARKDENIVAVSFGSWFNDIPYSISIYENVDTSNSNPTNGKLLYTQDGTSELAGYHTIPLKNPVSVAEGTSFSVVVTIKKIDNNWLCRDSSGRQTNSFLASYNLDTNSYNTWYSETTGCYCIKAFTDDTPESSTTLGDVNCDDVIDIVDVLVLNKYLLGVSGLSDAGRVNSDVNHNGQIEDADAMMILKSLVKLITLS